MYNQSYNMYDTICIITNGENITRMMLLRSPAPRGYIDCMHIITYVCPHMITHTYSCMLHVHRRVILKLRCPNWRLEEVAERMHMKLRRRDGLIKRFKVSRRDYFINPGSNGTIFKSSERQQIIDFIVRSNIKDGGSELDEGTELGMIRRFIYVHMHVYIYIYIYIY